MWINNMTHTFSNIQKRSDVKDGSQPRTGKHDGTERWWIMNRVVHILGGLYLMFLSRVGYV